MIDIIKKSYETTVNNPTIMIFWVAYLFIIPICSQILLKTQGSFLFIAALLMIILLNSAFFAGWFAIIKKAVKNADKVYLDADEKYKDILSLNAVFFGSIPSYILPVLGVFVIYAAGYTLWLMTATLFAQKFIGNIDFLIENIKNISGSTAQTLQYLQSLSVDQLKVIYGWQIFLVFAITVFGLFTLFLPAALYFEKDNKKNPLKAFVDSAKTILKRPLGVLGFSLVIQFLFFILMTAQILCMFNIFLYFVYLVISIYITVFMVVLLFNYYDKRFADNSYNGSDSIG